MSPSAGFLYVLASSARPGVAFVGFTPAEEDLQQKVQSGAEPLTLVGTALTADGRISMQILKGMMSERALGTHWSGEAFREDPANILAVCLEIAARVAQPGGLAPFADLFYQTAAALMVSPDLQDLEQACHLASYASREGHAAATFTHAIALKELARKRPGLSEAERVSQYGHARMSFLHAGELGAPRGYAWAAAISLGLNETDRFYRLWAQYLAELEAGHESPQLPEEEVGFFVGMLFEHMFCGSVPAPTAGHYIQRNRKRLLAESAEFGPEFTEWVRQYSARPWEGIARSLALPVGLLIGSAVLFKLYPWQSLLFWAPFLCLIGFGQMVKRRAQARKARNAEKAQSKRPV